MERELVIVLQYFAVDEWKAAGLHDMSDLIHLLLHSSELALTTTGIADLVSFGPRTPLDYPFHSSKISTALFPTVPSERYLLDKIR